MELSSLAGALGPGPRALGTFRILWMTLGASVSFWKSWETLRAIGSLWELEAGSENLRECLGGSESL